MNRYFQASVIPEPATPGGIPDIQQPDAAAEDTSLFDPHGVTPEGFVLEHDPALSAVGNNSAPTIQHRNVPGERDLQRSRRAAPSPSDSSDGDTDQKGGESPSRKRLRRSPWTTKLEAAPSAGKISASNATDEATPRGRDVSPPQRQMDHLPLGDALSTSNQMTATQLGYLEPEPSGHHRSTASLPEQNSNFHLPTPVYSLPSTSCYLASHHVSSGAMGMGGTSGDHVAPDSPTAVLCDTRVVQDSPPTRSSVSELSPSTVYVAAPSYPFGARNSTTTTVSGGGSLMAAHEGYAHTHHGARPPFLRTELEMTDGAGPSIAHNSPPQHGRSLSQSQESEQGCLIELQMNEDALGDSSSETSRETSPNHSSHAQSPTHDDTTDQEHPEHAEVELADTAPSSPRFQLAQLAKIYNAFVALAHLLEDDVPHGLPRREFNNLPTYRFNPEVNGSHQVSGVVCQFPFEAQEMVRELPCSHVFHISCADR